MSNFGEFIDSNHYYVSGAYGQDPNIGYSLDVFSAGYFVNSAEAMILTHNIGVLCEQSLRHLVSTTFHRTTFTAGSAAPSGGGGLIANYDWVYWRDVNNEDASDISNRNPEDQLSWAGNYNRVYGPFYLISDRQLSTGASTLRNLRIMGTINASAYGNKIVVAITKDKIPPRNGNYLALKVYDYPNNAFGNFDFILKATDPIPVGGQPIDVVGPVSVRGNLAFAQKCWIWVGVTQQNNDRTITALDIFETRAES